MSEEIQAAMREVVKNYFDGQLDGEKWFYKQPNENMGNGPKHMFLQISAV